MMTIILPGYSIRNKEWAEETAKNLKLKAESKAVDHHWKHWQTGGSLSVRYEVEKVLEEVGRDTVNILAKSVGTMVTMHLLQKIPGQIKKVILCGIPSTSDKRLELFSETLVRFPAENIIVFQNEKDPLGSYETVQKFMSKVNPKIKVVKMPRSDHHYPYPTEFSNFLNS